VTATAVPAAGWQSAAVCRGHLDVFYPPGGLSEAVEVRAAREAEAKALCACCPVARPCAAFALSLPEPYGIWGGMTERERWARLHPGRPLPKAMAR
jgi:WhiB family transcriptional regulator, redox-sensing transcriptional regulator